VLHETRYLHDGHRERELGAFSIVPVLHCSHRFDRLIPLPSRHPVRLAFGGEGAF
jgi:hypothetical protein